LLGEHFPGGGFAHANRTGKTEDEHWSAVDQLILPQEAQQRQKRETKDSEKISVNALKQMNSDALKLIGAHAAGRPIACHVEVIIEETVGKIAHGQPRRIDTGKNRFFVADEGEGRMKFVGAAAQGTQLLDSRRTIGRVAEAYFVARKG